MIVSYKIQRAIFILLLSIILISISFNLSSQNIITNKKYSASFTNKNISEMLEELKKLTGLEFSYNSEIIPKDIISNFSATQKTIEEILTELFEGTNLKFKIIDNSILIYEPRQQRSSEPNVIVSKDKKIKILEIYDTIITYQQDTLINVVYDTIKLVKEDTILIYDTVEYIIKKTKEPALKWSIDLYGGPLLSLYDIKPLISNDYYYSQEYKKALSLPLSYQIGTGINLYYKKISVGSGIVYSHFRENIDFNKNYYLYFTNSYFKDTSYLISITDTITYKLDDIPQNIYRDKAVMKNDSVEKFFTDSSLEILKINSKNKFNYIEIPLFFGYQFQLTEKIGLDINTGIISNFLFSAKGKTFHDTTIYDIDLNEHTRTNFSITFYPSINYAINNNIHVFINLQYKKTLISIYKPSYYLINKPAYIGLHAGIRFYL